MIIRSYFLIFFFYEDDKKFIMRELLGDKSSFVTAISTSNI